MTGTDIPAYIAGGAIILVTCGVIWLAYLCSRK